MRRIEHIIAVTVINALALLLVAMPALAQPPDTLLLTPCQLASLSSVVNMSTPWVRGLTETHLIAPDDVRELETIAATVAPDPLSDFYADAMVAARLGTTPQFFHRIICTRYPQYDCETAFDLDLLDRAFRIGKRLISLLDSSLVVVAPSIDSPTDSIPILLTSWSARILIEAIPPPRTITVDSVRILRGVTFITSHDRRIVPLVDHDRTTPWPAGEDSTAIARWRDGIAIGSALLYRLPLREELRRHFAHWSTEDLHHGFANIFSDLSSVDPMILVTVLDSLGADTTYTPDALAASLKHLICSRFGELDCEHDFDFGFSDSARWGKATPVFRRFHSRYLSRPDRIYAVVLGEEVITYLALPVDRSQTTPNLLTREEIDRVVELEGDDWHERLMRSIREEECWAERMEGF